MNETMYQTLVSLVKYKTFILFIILLMVTAIAVILILQLISKIKFILETKESDDELLKNIDYDNMTQEKGNKILRNMVKPDGADPNPPSYTVINDGGKDVYIRSFTIKEMPKQATFANTFARMLNFPDCSSSIFVEPIEEKVMSGQIDRHIMVLESERINAAGDPNRSRKLLRQERDAEAMADALESGETDYYNVGFLFSVYTDKGLDELDRITDRFRAEALRTGIEVICMYGLQAEGYISNGPFNRRYAYVDKNNALFGNSGIEMFKMSKYGLSTVFNYTQSSHSHLGGVPLGRNIGSGYPYNFDIYDKSHDGYTILVCGKTNAGKSAMIKMLCIRNRLLGYRFAAVDSQALKGRAEGEYAQCATLMGGVNFQISNRVSDMGVFHILNPFQIDESKIAVRSGVDTNKEIRTLELKNKVTQVVNNLFTMIIGEKEKPAFELETFLDEELTDAVQECYSDFGIRDGEADSIYEIGDVAENGVITSGKVRKAQPTISYFYKKELMRSFVNKKPEKQDAYNIILSSLKKYVKELYYAVVPGDNVYFFTKEEFMELPLKDGSNGVRIFTSPSGTRVEVTVVYGTSPYFDGQSNVTVDKDCPFTNIDISQLTEKEKVVARQVALDYLNENFIKKNSENGKDADKMVAIFDEAHEQYKYQRSLDTIDNAVRTARKRHVGIILSTQAVREYDRCEETRSILRNAATKFVFKQDYQDKKYLMTALGVTEAQADKIIEQGGDLSMTPNKRNKDIDTRRRGEVCVIEDKKVSFIKVDYIKHSEKYAVETDGAEINKMYHTTAAS